MDDAALERLSREGQLYLSLVEMQTIQAHFRSLGRDPTDVELETIAQTWSEHCSHKTLAGRIHYRGPEGERHFQNMLKETIFAATQKIRHEAGQQRLVRERLFRQRRRRSASTTSTTWFSRSKRTITLRPWSLTAGRTRASAA